MTPTAIADAASGNLIQLGMLGLLGVGQAVTWWSMMQASRRQEVSTAAERAITTNAEAIGVKDAVSANVRVATALEELTKWARKHDLDCTAWRATAEELFKQLAKSDETMARTLENQQRQITNVALGIAPQEEAQHVPSNAPRRRAGR